ncbi:MAG: bifunctional diaminohydroxyphosphoribosylaminopyrimidine deaminase/5-amino-6-(5-phosphoribosylamino)uracil reductase RibD [Moorellales bacterium]
MCDLKFMRRALELAERGAGWTSPNPAVGAVVVRDHRIVGEGYHHRAGEAHAEVNALRQAGELARGSTLYVTLEPCNHYGRTPPCTEAILAAGVRRVVAATADANPRVRGRGLLRLAAKGLQVEVGLERRSARRLNEAFAKYVVTGIPWVSLKMAMSLDGKAATRTGDSRWITGPTARQLVHELRHRHDAVLVGVGTILRDNPQLTVRWRAGRDPIRIVLDSSLRLPLTSRVLTVRSSAPTWVATTAYCNPNRRRALEEAGVEVLAVEGTGSRVDLHQLLVTLGQRGVTSVLVEGGPTVAAAFLEADLVDRLYLFVAPKVVGGREAPGPVGGSGVGRMTEALRLHQMEIRPVGADWLVTGYPVTKDPEAYWTA